MVVSCLPLKIRSSPPQGCRQLLAADLPHPAAAQAQRCKTSSSSIAQIYSPDARQSSLTAPKTSCVLAQQTWAARMTGAAVTGCDCTTSPGKHVAQSTGCLAKPPRRGLRASATQTASAIRVTPAMMRSCAMVPRGSRCAVALPRTITRLSSSHTHAT